MNADYVLVEGNLDRIKTLVQGLEQKHKVSITKEPTIGLTMVKANDSVEYQEFYLGEVLITETEVAIQDKVGTGICVGDEPVRSYCMAVVDAVLQLENDATSMALDFLHQEADQIKTKEQQAIAQIQKTKVDFKLMDQS